MKHGIMVGIKIRIFIGMLVSTILVSLILSITAIAFNYNGSRSALQETTEETALAVSNYVSSIIDEFAEDAGRIGKIAMFGNSSVSVDEKKSTLDYAIANGGYKAGTLYAVDGTNILNSGETINNEVLASVLSGKTIISEPEKASLSGDMIIRIYVPIWENGVEDSKITGVASISCDGYAISNAVVPATLGKSGRAFVLDKNGVVIGSTLKEDVSSMKCVINEADNNQTYRELANIEKNMIDGKSGSAYFDENGTSKVIAYAPIEGTNGWSFAIVLTHNEFTVSTNASITYTIIIVIVVAAISLILSYLNAKRISGPIKASADRLEKIAEGDVTIVTPDIKTIDETAILINVERLLKKVYTTLNNTMVHVEQSSQEVASGSNQVSIGAQALAQGATEQASAVEELSSTVSEISDHIKHNAEVAQEASKKSEIMGADLAEGNNHMQDMIKAISEISERSHRIGKIIKTIDDIAFQTNILALNAAVEAARAGEAGKGFAVVADEVRNLASKSAEAARDTTTLIEETVNAVGNGTKIADETAQSLTEVVSSVQEVVQMLEGIAQQAVEQSASIEQIAIGIDQISTVVQTNSATAEESAAASEQLNAQAHSLTELVLNLRNNSDSPFFTKQQIQL